MNKWKYNVRCGIQNSTVYASLKKAIYLKDNDEFLKGEQMFKVGDWVRHKESNNIYQVKGFSIHGQTKGFLQVPDEYNLLPSSECELWQPKQGEWCWFWNNEKDLTLQKFWKTEQNYFIVAFCEKYKNDGIIFYDVTDKHFKNCEPFIAGYAYDKYVIENSLEHIANGIGELPSFLKKNK